ncbi:hypothetical protein [Litoribacillus peritrichatus]|uniref:Uncharacterized protein n=1 Tax=Litoribacillus peritrichatus TaxID=718191 RepID=A0ABP7MJ86_9GAMM
MNTVTNEELENFVESEISSEALVHLKRQAMGGANNAKGNQHEQYFAVYKIAKFYQIAKNDDIEVCSQSYAFVDDLVILNRTTSSKHSYQLKDSKRVYWNGGKGIAPYFRKQNQLDKELYDLDNSEVVLVLADINVYRSRCKDIPSSISSYTRCINFKNPDSVNQMLMENQDFKAAVGRLCVSSEQIDKLEVIVQHLLGAWSAFGQKNVKISSIINKAREVAKPNFFKSEVVDPDEAKEIPLEVLDSIEGLSYELCEGFLHYSYKDSFQGQVKPRVGTNQFKAICNEIRIKKPTKAIELITLLMSTGENL